ncbi:MAG: CoA ester lyase [Dermatophilus congolensis]|nr:CoA ester lyase [Dermatophilus congolensis]
MTTEPSAARAGEGERSATAGPSSSGSAGDASALGAAQTWLFVPGDRPERFDKAASAGADLAILDLEDAVSADAKDAARDNVVAWLRDGGRAVVRINAAGTAAHDADVAAMASLAQESGQPGKGIVGVMVPMAASAASLASIHEATGLPLIALVETAVGVLDARELGSVPGVERIAFGAIDFSVDIDADETPENLLFARMQLVLASRAAGLAGPIDGVTTDLSGTEPTAADARSARALGMAGKLCVHPKQVAPAAEAFAPTPEQKQWAQGVLDATAAAEAEGRATGAIWYDGHMVDEPVREKARRILARA